VSQQPDTPNEPLSSLDRPFQFSLKHLLAMPVVVAVFFGVGTWLGVAASGLLFLVCLTATGLYFRATRLLTGVLFIPVLLAVLLLPMGEYCRPAARWFLTELLSPAHPSAGGGSRQVRIPPPPSRKDAC